MGTSTALAVPARSFYSELDLGDKVDPTGLDGDAFDAKGCARGQVEQQGTLGGPGRCGCEGSPILFEVFSHSKFVFSSSESSW